MKVPAENTSAGVDSHRKREKVRREEQYGELDRPMPCEVITDIKEKFVEWDVYKMSVMSNLIRS